MLNSAFTAAKTRGKLLPVEKYTNYCELYFRIGNTFKNNFN